MKIKIRYYVVGDSLLSFPKYISEEIVELKTTKQLDDYIAKKKDPYGHPYKRDKSFGFDFISNAGAIKISQVKIKKLT